MEPIAIITSSGTVFENFVRIDLDGNPRDPKYKWVKQEYDIRGLMFEKAYVIVSCQPRSCEEIVAAIRRRVRGEIVNID